MREIFQILIFFLAKGFLTPTFEDFSYYFLLDVVEISKMTFAIIVLVSFLSTTIGATIYKAYCRAIETRTLIFFAIIINSTGLFFNFVLAKRWNLVLGISDIAFIFFSDVLFNTLSATFFAMPICSYFAKVTPKAIEATMYAILSGTMDLS